MKRFNCITDKRECVITPPLIKLAVEDITSEFKKREIKIEDGLINPKLINELLWS